ncbi:acyl-CoA dehydrogenase family protein [Dactylosporangium roseum]|uniref:Acyl-CoA dehydrogenase family protein n=1 Tax=Dactylosporangium roseum TaxID=47989 RepID=A0ABY5ZAW8_9ACTN|nr:acyl-CoA dehydrogenase family protein [Dactylosporangium roseum]UWZ39233.1 acyl-CoA dehydrogenase family protein [Dactylosporangium roseum]
MTSDEQGLFELPPELKSLRSAVREFVARELIPLEATVAPQQITREQKDRLRGIIESMGLWQLDLSEEFGGPGLDLLARCVVYEEVGHTTVVPMRGLGCLFGPRVGPILEQCTEEQRERFLYPAIRGELKVCFAQTESEAGSDPSAVRTRAVRRGDHYVLDGSKRFITDAWQSDYAQVLCQVEAEDGQCTTGMLMVDLSSPGVTHGRRESTMMGDAPSELVFQGVRVPSGNLLGGEGGGFALSQRWLSEGRIKRQGALCLGIAQRALDLMVDYSRERTTFGRPLRDRQAVQFMVADSTMELEAARLLVHSTAARFDRGEDVRNASYMVKITSVETACRIVDRALQVHGGVGLTHELPLEYWYRQTRSMRITEGAHEVLRSTLGRNLTRK